MTLRNEKDCPNFLNGLSKYSVQFGIKIGIREVIIPKFIDNLSDWFKKILNEKLLPLLLSAFDQYFERLGTHLIILQEKYNIKKYTDCIFNKIKKFFYIICDIQKIIIPYLKQAMKKARSKGVNILQIINEFIDKLFSKMESIMKPIKEFVDKVFDGNEKLEAYKLYENVIAEGYNIIRKKGINQYEKIKKIASDKYTIGKNIYLNKRKEICNLPDELEKKFEEKKNELIEKYKKLNDNIINSTNELIEQLKSKNLSEEFRECLKNFKNCINNKLNEIKDDAKNKIKNIMSKIPNFIDNFTNIIDSIMGINFGLFKENKIDICKHIMTFFLKVKSGEIIIIEKNEKGEFIEKDIKQLLIFYLDKELNIEAGNIMEIVEYLLENGLKSIIISKINNNLVSYSNKKFEIIKSCYEPILEMIKKYFDTFKEDISKFTNKFTDKINEKIDYFDYFIKYINCIFQNKSLYEFYYIIEENILIHNDLKVPFLEGINKLKDKLINDLSDKFEIEINKLYEKIINSKKYKAIKKKSKETINDIVDKTENKVFGYINKILKDKEEICMEKENKNEKESEFDKFDKNIGKKIDNIICSKGNEIEQKFIKYAKKLDNQSQEYLKLKFGNKIDKKKFDDLFNSINILKEKKNQLLNSENIKKNFNQVDGALLKVADSKHVEKVINFIDNFDIKLANVILEEIEGITPLLEAKNKEDFRDNIKKLIQEKINKLYIKLLEPKLKELVIKISKELFDKIDKKLNKKND